MLAEEEPIDFMSFYLVENLNNNKIISDINNFITEELTVNDKQATIARQIFAKLNEIYNSEQFFEVDGYRILQKMFTCSFFGKELSVIFNLYDYDNKKVLEHYKQQHIINSNYNDDKNCIVIGIKSINKQFNKNLIYNKISHELTHAMQNTLNKKSNNRLNKNYRLSTKNYNSNNPIIRAISSIFYLCDNREIESFGNGLYAELEEQMNENGLIKFEETDTYRKIERLKKSLNIIKENKDNVEQAIISSFNSQITYKRLVNIGEIGYKKMLVKCGKIIVKFTKDYDKYVRF